MKTERKKIEQITMVNGVSIELSAEVHAGLVCFLGSLSGDDIASTIRTSLRLAGWAKNNDNYDMTYTEIAREILEICKTDLVPVPPRDVDV